MAERFKPKEITQDPDIQVVGGFGGLSSASYQSTGDIAFADKLVNGIITSRNEISVRKGTRVGTWIGTLTPTTAANISSHSFVFDGVNYMAVKAGRNFLLMTFDANWQFFGTQQKTTVFYAKSETEEANFTTVIEGNTCYVLAATKYSPLFIVPIFKRELTVTSVPTSTTLTGTISQYPYTSSISANNLSLFDTNGSQVKLTSASQTTFTLSITTTSAHSIANGSTLKVHFWYYTYGTSCNYYPGSYLYNSAVRRNSIPLDVNVAVPAQIYANPLLSEPQIQDLSSAYNTTEVWKSQSSTVYSRVTNQNPATNTEWDFSDGAYLSGSAAILTTRSPYFVSFGGLSAGGNSEATYFFRWREILVSKNTNIQDSHLVQIHDLVGVPGRYMTASGGSSVAGNAKYFTVPTATRPALSAVVELLYTFDRPNTVVVDFRESNATITISDGCIFPIYGYSDLADIRTNVYPNQIITVGNRVVVSGYGNRVTFSHADWSYRGISWNNFQVSDIDFTVNSAYTVSIGQRSSVITGTASVNGVMIVGTDTGVYRISGSGANTPPNASTANVSRISNEIVNNPKCLLIYENRVFFVSSRGLYQLQYSDSTEELNITPLSTQVSDFFDKYPVCLNYSSIHRGFVVYFRDTTEALLFTFASETFSTIKFAFAPLSFAYSQSLDGLFASFTDGANVAAHILFWDNASTTDLSNALLPLSPYTSALGIKTTATLLGGSVSVSSSPTNVNAIVPPADFVSLLSATLAVAYGENHAVTSSSPETINYPTTAGIRTYPIECFFVSKGFTGDKLIRANRVRGVNLLLTGAGTASTGIVLTNRTPSFEQTSVNSSGSVQETPSEVSRVVSGDLVNIRLRVLGVSEFWAIAVRITGSLKLLGYQFDTSSKKRGRLQP